MIINEGRSQVLCPNSHSYPIHPAHQQATHILDAFYTATEQNDELEIIGTAGPAYEAADNASTNYMSLYREGAEFFEGTRRIGVIAYFFRCRVCGFVLPATAHDM